MKNKRITNIIRKDIVLTLTGLKHHTGQPLSFFLEQLGISRSTFYRLNRYIFKKAHSGLNVNGITPQEEAAVINYAKTEGNCRHRELAYRMIDHNIAYMSPTTVYRILKKHNLIYNNNEKRKLSEYYNPHEKPDAPDKLWQSDITYIHFQGRTFFLLVFIDVFSRYITYSALLTDMTGYTVSQHFQKAVNNKKTPILETPSLQTDNGSCFVGQDFKAMVSQLNVPHNFIAPRCPNQNAEIERCNRTLKEGLLNFPIPVLFQDLEITIQKVVDYYNNQRYHSSLNFLPPKIYYRGNPEEILRLRKEKLLLAKKKRIAANLALYQITKSSSLYFPFCPTFS